MAVTKIHPIKSTLKKALDYIENPAKTDEKMLVSSLPAPMKPPTSNLNCCYHKPCRKATIWPTT